ncbi:hypothetical protein B484DRAFT_396814 [Ochromonadaceae sp. CCMP2298]|nr:hypothetical protein B484DRAFT_396814 [Ochromonadaceae sp. CCMP2298]
MGKKETGRSLVECSLWKIDVKGAFTLQDYAIPDCALFMAQLLRGYGVGEGYVDDFFGITLTDNLMHDMSAIINKVCALLGQNAINEAKLKHGRRMEIIGWDNDLEKKLQLQRLGSWARRYGQVNRLLLPFTTALNE